MEQNNRYQGYPHIPADVVFEYDDHGTIPVHAVCADGTPYTGTASGSISYVDWSGAYSEGLPHGTFRVTLGDRVRRTHEYVHGQRVKPS